MEPDVYMVCNQADIDSATGQCTAVHYVQAPTMLPPVDAVAGVSIAMAIIGVWALAFVYKHL